MLAIELDNLQLVESWHNFLLIPTYVSFTKCNDASNLSNFQLMSLREELQTRKEDSFVVPACHELVLDGSISIFKPSTL